MRHGFAHKSDTVDEPGQLLVYAGFDDSVHVVVSYMLENVFQILRRPLAHVGIVRRAYATQEILSTLETVQYRTGEVPLEEEELRYGRAR